MLNLAACRSKTARSPAGSPCCEKSLRGKGLMQGSGLGYRRADETSKKVVRESDSPLVWELNDGLAR